MELASSGGNWRAQVNKASSSPAVAHLKLWFARALNNAWSRSLGWVSACNGE